MDLKTSVSEMPGVGPAYIEKLKKIGIVTVEDLLMYLPRRWEDFSNICKINRLKPAEIASIHGTVWQIVNKRSRKGRAITEAVINDNTGSIKAVWFNQPFLTKNIKEGDEIFLAGKVEWNYGQVSMVSPSYELVNSPEGDAEKSTTKPKIKSNITIPDLTHVARIVPIYPETEGVTSKWLRSKIKPIMKYIYSIKDFLPESVREEEGLVDYAAAIRQMHFPEDAVLLKKSRDRLAFNEMFLMQLAVLGAKKKLKADKAISVPFAESLINKFVQNLSFDLTKPQRRSAWEIIQDLAKTEPMNRLLQGDVGSGKTVVAAMAMLDVAGSGSQCVLLAPTEILAKQHYEKLNELFAPLEIEVELLTGSTTKPKREEILTRIHEGDLKIVVGTHAVLEQDVQFWRLGLAIVDEQHRFGVEQRNLLRKESKSSGTVPHFLSMTATPIPRTLTLTLYGDLDVSVLDELPPGRQKIITKLVPKGIREDTYKFIEKELRTGRQAFVVCPLIGEEVVEEDSESTQVDDDETLFSAVEKNLAERVEKNDELENKSVMTEFENLKKVFPDFKVGFIHGRMNPAEKEKIMKDFKNREIKILVSTSVIEVGIDVPNASIMIIEDADRFGLSQLHQFRGRVGRGNYQSYCFLFTKTNREESLRRLRALAETLDGFKLAEIDLELRGPGDFIGTRQHGLPDIKMRNLLNAVLIKKCRDAATRFLESNELKYFPTLKEKVKKYDSILYLE